MFSDYVRELVYTSIRSLGAAKVLPTSKESFIDTFLEKFLDLSKSELRAYVGRDISARLARGIRRSLGNMNLRGERIQCLRMPAYESADVYINTKEAPIILKFMYVNSHGVLEIEDFKIRLTGAKSQGALTNYEYIRSLEFLECAKCINMLRCREEDHGQQPICYSIFLTNVIDIYARVMYFMTKETMAKASMSIIEGSTLHGNIAWNESIISQIPLSMRRPIHLGFTYEMHWQDYAEIYCDDYKVIVTETPDFGSKPYDPPKDCQECKIKEYSSEPWF